MLLEGSWKRAKWAITYVSGKTHRYNPDNGEIQPNVLRESPAGSYGDSADDAEWFLPGLVH